MTDLRRSPAAPLSKEQVKRPADGAICAVVQAPGADAARIAGRAGRIRRDGFAVTTRVRSPLRLLTIFLPVLPVLPVFTIFTILTGAGCQRAPESEPAAALTQGAQRPCPRTFERERQALLSAPRAVVTRAVADLLEKPAADSALADQALYGDVVTVRTAGDTAGTCTLPAAAWVQIETEASYHGYVEVSALRPWTEPAPYRSGPRVQIAARFANVFAAPDVTKRNPLVIPPHGVELRRLPTVVGDGARWLEVTLPDGQKGFVQRGDVREVTEPPAPDRLDRFTVACVLEQGLAHEGTPYLWGGRSTYGIDCSGLVSNALSACGVVPPRDANVQYTWPAVQPVERTIEALRPGDLLFFGAPMGLPDGGPPGEADIARAKITHVGIHLGDGRFVHATVAGRPVVQTSDLHDPDLQRKWIGARRHPQLH